MKDELTTVQAAQRLGAADRTVRKWCIQGRFKGARPVETPRGAVWTIPASALRTFERPQMGRPPKAKAGGSSDAKKGARK